MINHNRGSVVCRVFFILIFSLSPHIANAWVFGEHKELGETSFKNACDFLIENLEKKEDDHSKERLAYLMAVPCADFETKARVYGFRTALSGDHIDEPEDFESEDGEQQALSWFNYGALAMGNHDHFWPDVKTAWRKYHKKAIASARLAKTYWINRRSFDAKLAFDRALIFSAFADHFLQDAFSIGHNGFSRINSLQNPSLQMHNYWNKKGRWLKGKRISDADRVPFIKRETRFHEVVSAKPCMTRLTDETGRLAKQDVSGKTEVSCETAIWFAYGDEFLNHDDGLNEVNKQKLLAANQDAIVSVILAFLEDEDSGYSLLADMQFPVATENFEHDSAYFNLAAKQRGQMKSGNSCLNQEKGVYFEEGICWFDVEYTYTEPAYPDISLMLTAVPFVGYDEVFYGIHFAISPYTSKFWPLRLWPKNVRLYLHRNIDSIAVQRGDAKASDFSEYGISIALPNFYNDSPVSHEFEIAYAALQERRSIWDEGTALAEGGYVGLNTNLDVLQAKITIGAGWFFPSSHIERSKFKAQLMIGWTFGVIGGGPLYRWD